MHCIVMSAPGGSDCWDIHRSAEVIAYHRLQKRVSILFFILAESLKNDNILRFMHPGKVKATLLNPWPLPRHLDEPRDLHNSNRGILDSIYGEAFRSNGETLIQEQHLTAWDSWYATDPSIVVPYVHRDSEGRSKLPELIDQDELPAVSADDPVPFTCWSLRDFSANTRYLISFSLEFGDASYIRLLGDSAGFSIDGPRRLIASISSRDMRTVPEDAVGKWLTKLAPFSDERLRLSSKSYDVIVLGSPASEVSVVPGACKHGILKAPIQPECGAQRFVTANQSFTITLQFKTQEIVMAESLNGTFRS